MMPFIVGRQTELFGILGLFIIIISLLLLLLLFSLSSLSLLSLLLALPPPGSPSSWLSLLQPRELTSCWPRNQARATDWLTRRKMENDYSLTEQNIEIGATAAAIAPAAAAARSLD